MSNTNMLQKSPKVPTQSDDFYNTKQRMILDAALTLWSMIPPVQSCMCKIRKTSLSVSIFLPISSVYETTSLFPGSFELWRVIRIIILCTRFSSSKMLLPSTIFEYREAQHLTKVVDNVVKSNNTVQTNFQPQKMHWFHKAINWTNEPDHGRFNGGQFRELLAFNDAGHVSVLRRENLPSFRVDDATSASLKKSHRLNT